MMIQLLPQLAGLQRAMHASIWNKLAASWVAAFILALMDGLGYMSYFPFKSK